MKNTIILNFKKKIWLLTWVKIKANSEPRRAAENDERFTYSSSNSAAAPVWSSKVDDIATTKVVMNSLKASIKALNLAKA